jgi:hypothetical protein
MAMPERSISWLVGWLINRMKAVAEQTQFAKIFQLSLY